MEISNTLVIQFVSILLAGMVAGLLFAWQVSVIPGNKLVSNTTYLETMQNINREILNLRFFLVFIGSLPVLIINTMYQYLHGGSIGFWLSAAGAVLYVLGVFMVTGFGNVPLNNELDKLELSALSEHEQAKFRIFYESKWNQLHTIRTWFSVLVFVLITIAAFINN